MPRSPHLIFGRRKQKDIVAFRFYKTCKRRFAAHHVCICIILMTAQCINIIIDTFTFKHYGALGISLTGCFQCHRFPIQMKPVSRKTCRIPTTPKDISRTVIINKRLSVDIINNGRAIYFFSGNKKPFSFNKPERTLRTICNKHISPHLITGLDKGNI